MSSFNVPGNAEFANSKAIRGSQALLATDDIADAMMYAIENDDLEPGCGIQAFATGLEVIRTETHSVKKIKDIRKREGKSKL